MAVTMALFTRDLRVYDNPVLSAAHRAGERIAPVFVLDEAILSSSYMTSNKAHFLAAALAELDGELRRRGGRLIVRRGSVVSEVERLVVEHSITEVHVASDVSSYAARREHRLRERLARHRCSLEVHSSSVTLSEPGELTPAGGDHFSVFTPYYRKWLHAVTRRVLPAPSRLKVVDTQSEPLPSGGQLCTHPASPKLTVGGETTARRLVKTWLGAPVDEYHRYHDDLGADATSRLSAYLHFGCISPVELVYRSRSSTEGCAAFIRQIAWRDFYAQMLAARPDTARKDYRGNNDGWQHNPALFDAWCRGQTGYPIVDAGMRQLAAEGWMHNRARLITASFLTKTLRLDWRLGAQHFMSLLVDGDVANNQLNWQWVAGTGTDTRPYRVLNPVRQAERFDANGDYVRRWVPELAHITTAKVHRPWELEPNAAPDYPSRIVDHRAAVAASRGASGGL
ncbi:cryptochrome/photolyase family protein [Mycobacterium noviomagense]|uniref:Deoxyribodipyrimidine photo-lyase n=1 Tax=Mycobacterium noviomagense TaxID=459858 RepID=A0A7I7PGV0_9MYCO|nr:deoxyribodipyrimidine photo-lyase [Mycobacterium noviomagense]ORB12329.1 deoxyribodipyrimidine photolyase [Mycobacterium noviomagense]BBY07765.1 deoxyribodipyrimidine photo-lyase [Mycobacterium noviomagense]